MVKFFLVSTVDNIATYEYYPEDDRSKECGIIILDMVSGEINLEKNAEDDWFHIISAENMNDMRETINKMCEENGEKHLSDDEIPVVTEDELYFITPLTQWTELKNILRKVKFPKAERQYGIEL